MNTLKSLLLAGAAVIAMPLAALAIPISANGFYTDDAIISPGEDFTFSFEVMEDLVISGFALSGTGNNGGDDIGNVKFGFAPTADRDWTSIVPAGKSASALGSLEGRSFSAGESFGILFTDGIKNDVAVTYSFQTDAPAPVPVPAAGLLLGGTILGGAVAARRKKKVDA